MTPLLALGNSMLFILLALVAFTFLMQRPLKKQQQAQAEMRKGIEPGARVMLTSGLFGTVTHVGNEQLIVELAPGMEVTALKQAVSKVVAREDEEFEFADGDQDATAVAAAAESQDDEWARDEQAGTSATTGTVTPATTSPAAPATGGATAARPAALDDQSGDAEAMDDAAPGTSEGLGFPGAPTR